jgi:hypothetical protein
MSIVANVFTEPFSVTIEIAGTSCDASAVVESPKATATMATTVTNAETRLLILLID